nr:unnamed protein product [Digitaria exilis]
MSAALACLRRNPKRRRDAPDHALPPSSKQPLMAGADSAESSSSAAASASGADGASASAGAAAASSPPASPREAHFFVRATDSKTIAMHAGWDDTVGAVLQHLGACGYGRDLRLLHEGRQLAPEATLAELRLPKDSTLHLAARLRSTQHPHAWQLAAHIAATAAGAESGPASVPPAAFSLDELVKEFILRGHRANLGLSRHDRGGEDRATGDHAAEYLDIFIQAGAALALVRLYLSKSPFRSYAERAIKYFIATDPSSLPMDVLVLTAPVLLEFCRLLSLAAGKKELLYRSCRRSLASVLSSRPKLPPSMNSPTRLIEQILPFARETVDMVLEGLTSMSMIVSPIDLDEFTNFFKVMCQQTRHWISGDGPMPRNLYSRESEHGNTWIWWFHSMSMDVLKRLDECLKRLEMDLSLSSENTGVVESQTVWAARSHILVVLTELDFISGIYEDVGHNLQLVLMAHRAPLNALVRCSKRNERLHWLRKYKNLLCFEARRNLVFMMLPEGRDDFGELHEMLIDRSHLLDESFNYIAQARHSELRGGLFMEFKNEEATGPGVLREWFCLVCQALFSPKQVLFSPCPEDKRRFYLNETQVTHFTQGFADILVNPERRKDFFECLDLEDFDRLLGGSNDTINLQDWKSNTQYNGYKEKDRQITWFWKAVERMPIEQQRQLLFFWTSVKYLPSDGFSGLSSKLYIYKTSDSPDRLPSSQTCFYRLCLPPYTSLKMMETQLQKITQEHVSCSFGAW